MAVPCASPLQPDGLVGNEQRKSKFSGEGRSLTGKYRSPLNCNFDTSDNFSAQSEPTSFAEAATCKDKDHWLAAMKEELDSLEENKTWKLVDLPSGRKAIKCKWVYKIKRNASGEVERYKARLVVKGCSQKPGIDYQETYSPVVRYPSIRYFISLAIYLED